MEEEFVAKSGALVGRMTVAAAQHNLADLSHELETLQDFSHMLRARGLTEALEELARLVEEAHLDSRAAAALSDGLPVRGRPSPEKAAASSEMSGLLHSIDVAAQRVREYISADTSDSAVANAPSAATARPPSSAFAYGSAAVSASARGTSRAASRSASCDGQSLNGIDEGSSEPSALAPAAAPAAAPFARPATAPAPVEVPASATAAAAEKPAPASASKASRAEAAAAAKAERATSSLPGSPRGGGGGGGGGASAAAADERVPNGIHQRAVAGPISGFVQRGELMLERVRVLVENSNLKGVRREALKMKSMSAKLANRRLIALAEDLATHAEQANAEAVTADVAALSRQLNTLLNYSVRGMLVHNTLNELAEDLRLVGKGGDKSAALLQFGKACSEFGQLGDYLSIKKPLPHAAAADGKADALIGCCATAAADAASTGASAEGETREELQCKTTVAMCVRNGAEMLEAMHRQQLNGTLHHQAACRLVADTFAEVAATLPPPSATRRRWRRASNASTHAYVTDLVARNSMVGGDAETNRRSAKAAHSRSESEASGVLAAGSKGGGGGGGGGGSGAKGGDGAPPTPAIDKAIALEQFGGDEEFFARMCAKFVVSGKQVIGRINDLARGAAAVPTHAELRREAHSMKGAASTIGALQLSRAALALQLAAEGKSPPAELNALAREVAARFEAVEIELNGGKPPAEDVKAPPPRPRRGEENGHGKATPGSTQRRRYSNTAQTRSGGERGYRARDRPDRPGYRAVERA